MATDPYIKGQQTILRQLERAKARGEGFRGWKRECVAGAIAEYQIRIERRRAELEDH